MKIVLGCVTIGQAPRVDVVPDIAAVLGDGVHIVEAGALDGLTRTEVTSLAPRPGNTALASRMADGTAVALGKENILDLLQAAVTRVSELGATGILMLCTGKFPDFRSRVPIYSPDCLLHGAVDGLVPAGKRLGVLCPLPEQVAYAPTKWKGEGRDVVAVSASPYYAEERFIAEARRLLDYAPDIVLMDCMGYRRTHKKAVAQLFAGRPVILANTAAVRLLAEILECE
jgi:protein AroM